MNARSLAYALCSYVVYPVLLVAPCVLTALAYHRGHDLEGAIAVVTVGMLASLAVCERILPYEARWNGSDGQFWNDGALSLGGVAVSSLVRLVLASLAGGLASVCGLALWPSHLPLVLQVALALPVLELGLYGIHRALHELESLWPIHALHHSTTRLYYLNNFRVHPFEIVLLTICGTGPLVLLGADKDVILFATALSFYPSVLAHANVDARIPEVFQYVFNTPDRHRWHHSISLDESNANYGEGFSVFDVLFGSHFLPSNRRVGPLGIRDQYPSALLAQVAAPVRAWLAAKPS